MQKRRNVSLQVFYQISRLYFPFFLLIFVLFLFHRHDKSEATEEQDPELAQQNIKDRYYGKNDPVAAKILNKPFAKLIPPVDKEIKTLFISGITAEISEQDLRDAFYPYGEITAVKMLTDHPYAFITYRTRQMAEEAAEKLFNNLKIKETKLKVAWGRPQAVDGFGMRPFFLFCYLLFISNFHSFLLLFFQIVQLNLAKVQLQPLHLPRMRRVQRWQRVHLQQRKHRLQSSSRCQQHLPSPVSNSLRQNKPLQFQNPSILQ
jgi:RNA recognition motif-containing protein